eukprot:1593536-Pleurochrysis_carterae.AAC.6
MSNARAYESACCSLYVRRSKKATPDSEAHAGPELGRGQRNDECEEASFAVIAPGIYSRLAVQKIMLSAPNSSSFNISLFPFRCGLLVHEARTASTLVVSRPAVRSLMALAFPKQLQALARYALAARLYGFLKQLVLGRPPLHICCCGVGH